MNGIGYSDWEIDPAVKLRYHSEDLRQIVDIIDTAGGQTCDVGKILKMLTANNFIIHRYVQKK
jgi:hypothetical protein